MTHKLEEVVHYKNGRNFFVFWATSRLFTYEFFSCWNLKPCQFRHVSSLTPKDNFFMTYFRIHIQANVLNEINRSLKYITPKVNFVSGIDLVFSYTNFMFLCPAVISTLQYTHMWVFNGAEQTDLVIGNLLCTCFGWFSAINGALRNCNSRNCNKQGNATIRSYWSHEICINGHI